MSTSSEYTEYVEALQDYKYTNDKGEELAITQGTYYILLERTNSEWWHIQNMENPPKEFYVPASFVQYSGRYPEEMDEVFEGDEGSSEEDDTEEGSDSDEDSEPIKIPVPKGKPLPQIPAKSKLANNNPPKRISSFKPLASTPPPDYNNDAHNSLQNKAGPASTSPHQKIVCVEIDESPTIKLPVPGSSPPRGRVSPQLGKPVVPPEKVLPPPQAVGPVPPPTLPPTHSGPVLPVYANLDELRGAGLPPASEVQGQNEYANLNTIQAVLKPPSVPNPDNFIRGLCDNWELYSDSISGRQFYYNSVTKETTWKPPRGVEKILTDGETEGSAEEKKAEVNGNAVQSDRARSPSRIPRGYKEETAETGGKSYINEVTKDKWFAFLDPSGRQYFCKEGSHESVWQLPEMVGHSQSVSDTLSHVDVASRSAAIKGRMSKTKSMYVDSQDRLEAPRKSTTLPPNLMLAPSKGNNSSEMKEAIPAGSQTSVSPVFPRVRKLSLRRVGSLWDRPHLPTVTKRSDNDQELVSQLDVKDRFLNKTKVMENGKKLKKNWTSCYVVLSGSNLVFYKDQKASQVRAGSPHGKPEFIINLHGANVEFGGKDMSSRKNVILLTTARSSEDLTQYLLQTDDSSRIHHWYIALSEVVERIRQGVELPTDLNGSPGKKSPVATETDRLKRGKSTKVKAAGSGVSRSVSTEETVSQERRRRIRDILFHFMSRRPSPEVLKEKGIIKDVVFGCDLKQLTEKEGASVPFFIRHTISCIEGQGLNHDGLYRVSGNASQIQKLRCMVDQDQTYNFHDANVWDINVLTGGLKLFFRELKEPLFPFDLYNRFVTAIQIPQSSAKLKAFKEAVNALPKCNHETIKVLFGHLKKVTDQSKENRMQSHNLAIVFGPTLMWPEVKAPNMAVSLVFQNRVVEFILLEYDNLFR